MIKNQKVELDIGGDSWLGCKFEYRLLYIFHINWNGVQRPIVNVEEF